jgi:RimJ/RimL family protein N-acetyltransferase
MRLVTRDKSKINFDDILDEAMQRKPNIDKIEPKHKNLDYQDAPIYLRPVTINDLDLLNSWSQNTIINEYFDDSKWLNWNKITETWKSVNKSLIAIVVVVEPFNPLGFYCGRSIGYVEWLDWDKEYVGVRMSICDPAMWGKKIGSRLFDMAVQYEREARGTGKISVNVQPGNTAMMMIMEKYQKLGFVTSSGEIIDNCVNMKLDFNRSA